MAACMPVQLFSLTPRHFPPPPPSRCVSHIRSHCWACRFSFWAHLPFFGEPLQAFIKCHTANFPTEPNPSAAGFPCAGEQWHLSRLEISLGCPVAGCFFLFWITHFLLTLSYTFLAVFHSSWLPGFSRLFPLGFCCDNFIYFAIFCFTFVSAFFRSWNSITWLTCNCVC